MEEELNYLSEKIEDIDSSILEFKGDQESCPLSGNYYTVKIEKLEKEKEYLENIINFVTRNILSNH